MSKGVWSVYSLCCGCKTWWFSLLVADLRSSQSQVIGTGIHVF